MSDTGNTIAAAVMLGARVASANAQAAKRPPDPLPLAWCVGCQLFHVAPPCAPRAKVTRHPLDLPYTCPACGSRDYPYCCHTNIIHPDDFPKDQTKWVKINHEPEDIQAS